MSTTTGTHPLLTVIATPAVASPSEPLLDELRDLARRHDHCTARSRAIYQQFRKMLGQDRLQDCLHGIQYLAQHGEPAGARLLAGLLDANPPGALLLPRIRRLTSTVRLVNSGDEEVGDVFLREWQGRLAELEAAATARVGPEPAESKDSVLGAADRSPMPLLRRALAEVVPQPGQGDLPAEDLKLLAGLIRLECDAYQERVSRLAGVIDPFRVAAVMRALPLLNRADAEVRELNGLAAWLEAGNAEAAFERQVPTGHHVLDEGERPHLLVALDSAGHLAPLAVIYRAFLAQPCTIRQIAGPVARLLILGRTLRREGPRETDLDLLSAVATVQEHSPQGRLELPLTPELEAAVGHILLTSRNGGSDDLAGLEIHDGVLVVREPRLDLGDRIWRHDLPTLQEMLGTEAPVEAEDDLPVDEEQQEDRSASAVKQMVLNNVGSESILLGFLRNPKVTAIPGLVADVVRRTRTGLVL